MVWKERRTSTRHALEIPIRFQVLSEPKFSGSQTAAVQVPRTINISENGLLFLSLQPFKIGTILELTLPVKGTSFTMQGRVVHASSDAESGLYRTGISFPTADSMFQIKMAEQVYQIDQYRKMLSGKEGRVVSEEEAAHRWISEHSTDFADFYQR